MRYREIINEGRDAPLYHSTDIVTAAEIIRSDRLLDRTGQHVHGQVQQGVSLTRNYFHALGADVILVLDQARLRRDGVKLAPVLCQGSLRYVSYDRENQRRRECEEFAVGTIDHLHRYLTGILITPKGLTAQVRLQQSIDPAVLAPLLDHPKLAIASRRSISGMER